MLFSLALAVAMAVGVLFLREMGKALGDLGQAGPFLFVALMFAWDGIFIYMMAEYATNQSIAVGIALGTLLKTFTLIKAFKFKL